MPPATLADGKYINYAVSVVNGAGYRNTTRSSSMDVGRRGDREHVSPLDGYDEFADRWSYRGKLGLGYRGKHGRRRCTLLSA